MNPEDLAQCIEEAFAGLERPSLQEMALAGDYVDQSFLDGVGTKTWQELRPLRQYVGDGGEIVLLSAKAYQYYLPAYLYALIGEAGEEFYLNGVLDSLWYEDGRTHDDSLIRDLFDPGKGLDETMRELETQMPNLTDQERKAAAETRVGVAQKMAYIKELTGHDFLDSSHREAGLRVLWGARVPLLTDQQKRCIARMLSHILERSTDPFDVPHIQTALDGYWRAFLVEPGGQ
ncbi:MAG: hypothetical protein ABSE35_07000 [Bryobacteraceae bacterium]|jgi:hypothetical protein